MKFLALFIMAPWLFFDAYFFIMSILLLVLKNRSACGASGLESMQRYNEQAVILIPTYNNSKTVLNHLIPQIMEWFGRKEDLPISVILVDSSTDGTEKNILSTLNASWDIDTPDRSIAHIKNLTLEHLKKRQGGKSWAINQVAFGIHAKYFTILDSDWILNFVAIGKAIHYLEKNQRYVYAQLAWQAINSPINFVAGLDQVSIEYRHQLENRVRTWKMIPITIHGSAVVISTLAFREVGGFSGNVLSEDVDLTLRFILNNKFGVGLPDLTMQQPPCNHIAQFFWQKSRWAEGRSQMLRRYGGQITSSKHLTFWQKAMWIYYLAYFGRCVAFTSLFALMIVGFIAHSYRLGFTCLGVIAFCLAFRIAAHLITMMHRMNKVPLMSRFIEPFTFYGIGVLYTYTFFKGLFITKGVWRVVESKTYT